eukprot:1202125-Pyramimonas_sp.AAC.1
MQHRVQLGVLVGVPSSRTNEYRSSRQVLSLGHRSVRDGRLQHVPSGAAASVAVIPLEPQPIPALARHDMPTLRRRLLAVRATLSPLWLRHECEAAEARLQAADLTGLRLHLRRESALIAAQSPLRTGCGVKPASQLDHSTRQLVATHRVQGGGGCATARPDNRTSASLSLIHISEPTRPEPI